MVDEEAAKEPVEALSCSGRGGYLPCPGVSGGVTALMSAFGCGGGSTSKRSRASRIALYESMMVACSRLLIENR